MIKYSVSNPLIVNLLAAAVVLLGSISIVELPRELFPKVSFFYIFIIAPYPGAGSEEVEKLITIPIEDALEDIDDVKLISSESNEGAAFIWLQFEDMSEAIFKEKITEVKSLVGGVELPDGAEDPVIDEFDSDDFLPVIAVSVVGDMPERKLRDIAEDLRDDLLEIDDVARVALSGTREREIWIEIDPQKLFQHRLSLSQITQSIQARNLNVPAGEVALGKQTFLVRTVGEVDSPDGFNRIVVRWDPRGNHLHLGEIAKITDAWKEESTRARINGRTSATLSVSKSADGNSLDVIAEVKRIAGEYKARLPLGGELVFTNDNAIYIRDMLHKLQSNAAVGFVLVILILFVFMGFRSALVAAVGIPVAFMATFFLMEKTGQTMNGSALFGLILVLGVVVDDAIIVVENCYRHLQRGLSRREAAVVGTREVLWPVVSATMTTIAAFLPLLLMTGIVGRFLRVIPIIVSLALTASLIEVFLIAPSHFAEWAKVSAQGSDRWFITIRRIYRKTLIRLIRKRYLVAPAVILLAVLMAGLIPLVGVELFRDDEFSQVMVWVTMPSSSSLEETDRVIRRIEEIADRFPDDEVHAVVGAAGILQMQTDWIYGDHVGQVIVDLVEKEFRERSMDEIILDLREQVKAVAGPIDIKVTEMKGGPPTGKPVEVKIKGRYLDALQVVAAEVKRELVAIPGVHDVGDDIIEGKQEIQLRVDEDRAAIHGLTAAMVAIEVRAAIDGLQASVFHDSGEEVDVRVKVAGMKTAGIEELGALTIPTPTGGFTRIDNICDFVTAPTLFRIRRFERERAVTVSANIDRKTTTTVTVNRELERRFKDIARKYPGYELDFRGEYKEFQEAFSDLGKLFLIGVLLIFTILGAQFKSIRQSLIILLTIPFAFIGSMIGLLVIGKPFSIVTMYGMVALGGIAVNDAIVMISFINDARARGASRWRSVIQAGSIRLRPIILTSTTTILGLMPMAIGLSGRSEAWGPLANTIAWGLAVATLLTLLVIPTVYSTVVDDWFGLLPLKRRLMERKRKIIYS